MNPPTTIPPVLDQDQSIRIIGSETIYWAIEVQEIQ